MKCLLMRGFIWISTVCHSTRLGVSSSQRVEKMWIQIISLPNMINTTSVVKLISTYCKCGNFRKNINLANSIKRSKIHDKGTIFTYISKRQSDFAILQGLYFHKTSHPRSFAKIKPLQKFQIYSMLLLVCVLSIYGVFTVH